MDSHEQRTLIDLDAIKSWALEAALLIPCSPNQIASVIIKPDGTPTTSIDKDIEAFLLNRIRARYPEHGILAEEGGRSATHHEFLWVIDPLDGTRAFASGLPAWGISIGVLRHAEPIAGVFVMPAIGDLFWGSKDGAFYNGQPLAYRPILSLDDPLAFLAVPSNAHMFYNISFGRLRSLGSVAAHLAYVARGAAVGALTRRIKIWDIAGVLPLLQYAGIELRYLSGVPFAVSDLLRGEAAPEPLLAAHPTIMNRLLETIRLK